MGGRTMPHECKHGVTVDWGDFGPCQDCDEHGDDRCPNFVECAWCEEDRHPSGLSADFVAELGDRGWTLVQDECAPLAIAALVGEARDEIRQVKQENDQLRLLIPALATVWQLEQNGWLTLDWHDAEGELIPIGRVLLTSEMADLLREVVR